MVAQQADKRNLRLVHIAMNDHGRRQAGTPYPEPGAGQCEQEDQGPERDEAHAPAIGRDDSEHHRGQQSARHRQAGSGYSQRQAP
ncbi:hypothetical protein D3C80_1806900 [compost metagenome]